MNDLFDPELLPVFLEEAREQLDTLDQGLVQLEREPGNAELVQGIFRAAHTLKGSSGAMGFRQIADLTHAMEDVLDCVRQGTLDVTAQVTDQLLQGLDLLRAMEQAIERGEGEAAAAGEAAAVAASLRATAKHETAQAIVQPMKTDIPDDALAVLVQFVEDCQMPGIRAFMVFRALEGMGTLLASQPSREEIEAGQIKQRLLLMLQTECPEEALRQALMKIAEVDWVRVGHGGAKSGLSLEMPSREAGPRPDDARTPASGAQVQQTVRVSVDALDHILNLVGELVLDRTRVSQLKDEIGHRLPGDDLVRDLDMVSNHLGSIVGELHESLLEARMLPVSNLFNRFPRMVRDLCRTLNKDVEFVIQGENEQLDRSVIERLVDPLTHLLRNAIDHGMEAPEARIDQGKPAKGTIVLSATRKENHVLIEVRDDGPGINVERLKDKAVAAGLLTAERARAMPLQEAYHLVFASGLSTAAKVSDVSGRGVGMDVVRRNVQALGGAIDVTAEVGQGTTFSLQLPLTLAIVRALIVRVGQVPLAIPLSHVEESIHVHQRQLGSVRGRRLLRWRDQVVPVVRLGDVLPGCGPSEEGADLDLVAVRFEGQVVSLAVDAILGHQEIVVKSLGSFLGRVPGLAGATILGNGRVALILDLAPLFQSGMLQQAIAACQAAMPELAFAGKD